MSADYGKLAVLMTSLPLLIKRIGNLLKVTPFLDGDTVYLPGLHSNTMLCSLPPRRRNTMNTSAQVLFYF